MRKRGIYRKIFCLYPAYPKKVDLEDHFFCIYPVMWKKVCLISFKSLMQGTGEKFFPIYPGLHSNQKISFYRDRPHVCHGTCTRWNWVPAAFVRIDLLRKPSYMPAENL